GRNTEEALGVRGDIRLEFNLEGRHYVNDWIQVAAFVDAGNIWMTRPEDGRPDVEFAASRALDDFGVAAGGGVRLDFGYFLLRCDAGRPVRQPGGGLTTSNGWRIHPAVSLPF
ncbi:MAG: BamA/TamA family outer membrane protein, partial [Flavobacteriales bacterium]